MSKQYAERDIESLDELGGFYSRHVSAMTGEGLHTKSSIAAELGHRDMVISELLEALRAITYEYSLLIIHNFDFSTLGRDEEYNRALAAIAKATGETK